MPWQCKHKVGTMRPPPTLLAQTASDDPGVAQGPHEVLSARTGLHCHVGVHLQNHVLVLVKE